MPKAKAKTASGGAKPKKKANGYKFPERLPQGEVLVDSAKKQWVLGESIGQGGFGEIYCASEPGLKNKWPYVVKIEPHENGPLFMEKNFYIKVAKPDDVKSWKQKEGMKTLGIPTYLGSGTYMYKGTEKYRFLVIDRYGKDLWSLFLKSKAFPPLTVYRIALQIIDALRYIHSKDYVHGDIKGQNLLLGLAPGTENQVFLVDFGLACKYSQKEFQRDPKQAHNGTIEYTSCDWHMGVPTRRGDLEILGYNLLHWLNGSLPWEKDLAKCEVVHKKKQELMDNVESYITSNFSNIPKVIIEYMVYVSKLKHDEEPNYKYIKDLFAKELKKIGSSVAGPLEFDVGAPAAAPAGGAQKRTSKAAAKQAGEDGNQGKRSAPKRGATARAVVEPSDEEEAELSPPNMPARRKAVAQPKRDASTGAKITTAKRAAARKPTAADLSDEDMFERSDLDDEGHESPKPKTTKAKTTRTSKKAVPNGNPNISDEDMFEPDENNQSPKLKTTKAKTTRTTKKTTPNGTSKPGRGTKRSSPKSNRSPTKRAKPAGPTAPKKLDYRDAPKCLLPGIREEN